MGFVHIDHVGLVAYTIDQARQVLGESLGLELDEARSSWPDGSYFPPEQTYNYFFSVGGGETQVEVLIPEAGATSGAARFLERRGPGLHHLCYACTDVHAEAERLVANGLSEIALPRTADGRRTVAFFHPRSTGGVLTELVPVRPGLLPARRTGRLDR
jgi:methylmalonyl-CoA/ethylmalonyl-CoA epimerase